MMKSNDKKSKFVIDAINKMFELCESEKTYDDIKGRKDDWFREQKWTLSEERQWEEWFIRELRRRNIITNKKQAENEFMWFNLSYGPVRIDHD